MAKSIRGRRRIARATPYPQPLRKHDLSEHVNRKKCPKHSGKKDWEEATCSVCMEYPHNAVLLLCSSHDKGCRPYMCGTSFRYSNCLDQYKKAHSKLTQNSNSEVDPVLACPLCRGKVKGWTVVEPARAYLNAKTRSCMQEKCSFVGSFKELRKHVKSDHPCARPREVDPDLEQRWSSLEMERERNDVISTIRSSMPGAMVFGDYVIERGQALDSDDDEEEDRFDVDVGDTNSNLMLLFLHAFGNGQSPNNSVSGFDFSDHGVDSHDDGDENNGASLVHRLRRQGRVVLGRSGRRRRRREADNGSG